MSLILNSPLPAGISERKACDVLAICRNTLRAIRQRFQFCGPVNRLRRQRKEAPQPRALSDAERQHVKAVLNRDEYHDQPPAQVFHSLLQQGVYLCSISTMHRLIQADGLNGERRPQRPPQSHATPRLKATAPNQVWSWDIAKLATAKRGEYLSLYVVMDLFSRYIVAWMLSRKENSALLVLTDSADPATSINIKLESSQRNNFSPELNPAILNHSLTITGTRNDYLSEAGVTGVTSIVDNGIPNDPGQGSNNYVSVADALNTTTGTLLVVTGYVIQEVNGIYGLQLQDINNSSKNINVKLESQYRNQFNPQLNPSIVGQPIYVSGQSDTYMSAPGIRYVDDMGIVN